MTAKELFDKMLLENDECTSTEMMIEFAKYHVEQALIEASKSFDGEWNKNSILYAYPLENIK